MIQFPAKHLKSLMPFKEETYGRYYLNSVRVEPHPEGGVILIACNGHMMMLIRDANACCSEAATFKIGPDASKYCGDKGGRLPVVTINPVTERLVITGGPSGNELFIQPGKCMVAFKEGDKYPAWERVVPKFEQLKPAVADTLNASYLVKAANAHPLGRRHGMQATAIRLWQAAAGGAVAVEYDGAPGHMLIIMPIIAQQSTETAMQGWRDAFGACVAIPTKSATTGGVA